MNICLTTSIRARRILSREEKAFSPDFEVICPRSSSPTLTLASPRSRGPLPTFFYRNRVNFGEVEVISALELWFTPAVTFEAPGHHLGSSPSIPWESLRPVQVLSMTVPSTSSTSTPAPPSGSGLWGPVTEGSTPHRRWKFLECVACCRASPGTSWDHRRRRLRLRRLRLHRDRRWSSSFTNSRPSSLCIPGAKHRVQGRLVYGRGQELVIPKPEKGC